VDEKKMKKIKKFLFWKDALYLENYRFLIALKKVKEL